MKSTKIKINIPLELDFIALAVVCHDPDFKFCFELNNHLSIDLTRQKDIDVQSKKEPSQLFTHYTYTDEFIGVDYHVISNKSGNKRLIKAYSLYDFFISITGNTELINTTEFQKKINEMPIVIRSQWVDLKNTPQIDYLKT
jgi:hypothetical protein